MGRRMTTGGRLMLAAALLALLSLVYGPGAGLAARSADGMWRDVAEADISARGAARQIIPQRYRTLALDTAALRGLLAQAPLERTAAAGQAPILALPLPDGGFGSFRVVDSPIMEPGLAAKFPVLKTYSAQGIDDPTALARLDWTSAGFHAMILSSRGNVFIDPYRPGDTAHYISYRTSDYLPSQADIEARAKELRPANSAAAAIPTESAATGPSLRSYRLALAATGEYTAFHGGTVAGAAAAMVTSVNRVNAVYEREVAVRLVLIANNNLIIYTNAGTDPYTNDDGFEMLDQNQANIDSVIGNANYDIGHVFSTGGGGVALLGCICQTGEKAQGVTGSPAPVGDPFDIDYVAHEMGHQFGGDHTFNGTTGACGGGNREGPTAYEPGSGSTIMAYAGICGSEDLQSNSDPYFHTGSFSQITAYVAGGGSGCAAQTQTGNQEPVVSAGADATIPARTPFTLAGSATDPDGDALLFDWEQFDAGTAAPPNTDNGTRAIFRSFNPVASPARTFPKLSDILGNVATFGESLPTTTREMTFRLTARDNRAGGGGVAFDTMSVNVISTAGPFLVTAPNTAVSWTGLGQQTVTWDVANTTLVPVSCAAVNILLSTDGGLTFGQTLLADTPNDGTQSVTAPNISTTTARVKVQCATSVFFDLSNANFTITPGAPPRLVFLPLAMK